MLQQFVIIGQIQRRLGMQRNDVTVLALPCREALQDRDQRLAVADEIVIDQKHGADASVMPGIEFGNDLIGGFHPRLAAKGHDDVAEFTQIGTAARDLDAALQIPVQSQQVVAREGEGGHVGPLGLLITPGVLTGDPFLKEHRPGLIGLADEDHVGQAVQIVLLHGDPGSAHHQQFPECLDLFGDRPHAIALDDHAGETDNVGLEQGRFIDRFHRLVDQSNLVLRRCQGGQ